MDKCLVNLSRDQIIKTYCKSKILFYSKRFFFLSFVNTFFFFFFCKSSGDFLWPCHVRSREDHLQEHRQNRIDINNRERIRFCGSNYFIRTLLPFFKQWFFFNIYFLTTLSCLIRCANNGVLYVFKSWR